MRVLAIGFLAAMAPGVAMAGTLTVGAGQQYTGLQAAVTAATSGDTILVNSPPNTRTPGSTRMWPKTRTR